MTDSTPITRGEIEELTYHLARCATEHKNDHMAFIAHEMADWIVNLPEPPASPPRALGAPLPPTGNTVTVEAESGPGRTVDSILCAIAHVMREIEALGADPRLTDAVLFLSHARYRVEHFANGEHVEPLNVVISAAEIRRLREAEKKARWNAYKSALERASLAIAIHRGAYNPEMGASDAIEHARNDHIRIIGELRAAAEWK